MVPLAATLRSGGLSLDVQTANREVRRWLDQVANDRIHAVTRERPSVRLVLERQHLQPLPAAMPRASAPTLRPPGQVLPFPSLQHPLSVYGELLGGAA